MPTTADDSQAPDVTMPQQAPPSNLGQAVAPQMPRYDNSQEQQVAQDGNSQPGGGGSRLVAILKAVANVGSNGMAGIPDKGRSTFVTGLGEGARSEQAAQANQQAIKFRDFDNQVRAAQLHNEDVRMQWADEDHQAQVDQNAQAQVDRMKQSTGMTYTFVPNDDGGKSALAHMGGQMAQDGSVSIPAGTIASPKGWYIPNKSSADQAQANTKDYNARATFYGLPPVTSGVVNDKTYDLLRNMSNGLDTNGEPVHANELQSRVDNMSSQLAEYKKQANTDPTTIDHVQEDIDHLSALGKIRSQRETDAITAAQRQQATGAALTAGAVAKAQYPYKEQLQDNAAADKPQPADKNANVMMQASLSDGSQVAGTPAELKAAGVDPSTMAKLPSADQSKVTIARQLISPNGLLTATQNSLAAFKPDELSNLAAHWDEFKAGKWGADNDPRYIQLRTNAKLLSTALMQMHVGAKGSESMMAHFNDLADTSKMDLPTLKTALAAERSYAQEKAMLPKQQSGPGGGGQGSQPPQGATHTAKGSDGKLHYTNALGQDLGVAQ